MAQQGLAAALRHLQEVGLRSDIHRMILNPPNHEIIIWVQTGYKPEAIPP